MAGNRCVTFSERERKNVNTMKKTSYDLRSFKELLPSEEERRENPVTELQEFAIKFVLDVFLSVWCKESKTVT